MRRRSRRSACSSKSIRITSTRMATWRWNCSRAGKNDEAIAAYRKQLEISPYDKTTLKNFGLLLAQMGRDADARTELEAAAAIPPDDPETKMALAQVYGRLGEKANRARADEGTDGRLRARIRARIFLRRL